ncbi:helix-turn-helix domain-containing protein [Marinilactibacillus psychrotolerans]|uniref:helix-turn-helix domain-containing protein n=1 Tax=Marinilactibacillus psychrotolerans TaxID=191770 RepID=UPI00388B2D8F
MENNFSKVPFDVIVKACDGDPEAIQEIIDNYSGYIGELSLRPMKDNAGHEYRVVDETLKGRMQIRLITKILAFEIEQPSGKECE